MFNFFLPQAHKASLGQDLQAPQVPLGPEGLLAARASLELGGPLAPLVTVIPLSVSASLTTDKDTEVCRQRGGMTA